MDWDDFLKTASATNPYAPRPPSKSQKRLRLLLWTILGAFAVAGVLGVACLIPSSRAILWGVVRGERFADGMPRHYWLAAAREEHKDPWTLKALGDIGHGDAEVVRTLADALPAEPDAEELRPHGDAGRPPRPGEARPRCEGGAAGDLCGADQQGYGDPTRAASAVAAIGPDDALVRLRNRLTDADPKVRAGAAEAIGVLAPHSEAVVAALTDALDDKEDLVKFYAAEALGAVGPSAAGAVPRLLQLEDHGPFFPSPHRAAIIAFGKIGPAAKAAVPTLAGKLGDVFDGEDAARSLAAIGPDAAPALVKVACDDGADERRERTCRRPSTASTAAPRRRPWPSAFMTLIPRFGPPPHAAWRCSTTVRRRPSPICFRPCMTATLVCGPRRH